jgi:UDP-N-acetylmuramoyl-L-alanyl-D-glutamate--2,6-diaminopimelate ligase
MMAAHKLTGYRLAELLSGITGIDPNSDCNVTGLALDSRRVVPGDLFLACSGYRSHGRQYIDDAIASGAAAVLWDADESSGQYSSVMRTKNVPIVAVENLREWVGEIASRFYGHPSHDLLVIGITGTNGKTSCSQFLAQVLSAKQPCGVIGTLGYGLYGALQPASHTTPDGIKLQSLLAELRDIGVRRAVMEVSSHGLDQGRINGTEVDVAVFTNLTRDHLDYHDDMAAYGQAKQRLFTLPSVRHVVVNSDDDFGRELLRTVSNDVQRISYGLEEYDTGFHIRAYDVKLDTDGILLNISTPLGEGVLRSALLGRFNISNLLAVLGILLAIDIPLDEALERLATITTVPGRMEHFRGGPGQPLVVVDYAHTPDALKHVLAALREHQPGKLWCVFGCGGDRDRGKRPLMGQVAEQLADTVVLTDDNPRSEDPVQITAEILTGFQHPESVTLIHDRAAAIQHTIAGASHEDIVLVAGKGHEEYQLVGDRQIPFSDRDHVASLLNEVAR